MPRTSERKVCFAEFNTEIEYYDDTLDWESDYSDNEVYSSDEESVADPTNNPIKYIQNALGKVVLSNNDEPSVGATKKPGIYIVLGFLNTRNGVITKTYLEGLVKDGLNTRKVKANSYHGRFAVKCRDATKGVIPFPTEPVRGRKGGCFVQYGPMELFQYNNIRNHSSFDNVKNVLHTFFPDGSLLFAQVLVDFDDSRRLGEWSEAQDGATKIRREADPSAGNPFVQKKLTHYFSFGNQNVKQTLPLKKKHTKVKYYKKSKKY